MPRNEWAALANHSCNELYAGPAKRTGGAASRQALQTKLEGAGVDVAGYDDEWVATGTKGDIRKHEGARRGRGERHREDHGTRASRL